MGEDRRATLAVGDTSALFLTLAVLIALFLPGRAPCQPDSQQLEERLSGATGRERLELLVELTTQDRKKNPAQAVTWGIEALELLGQVSDDRLKLEVLTSIASAYLEQSQYQESLPYAEKAARLAQASGDQKALAEALSRLGYGHQKLTETSQALEHYDEAIRLYEELGDVAASAFSLAGRCVVHIRLGDYPQALKDCLRAHEFSAKSGDRDELTEILNNLGLVHGELGQEDAELQFYYQALDLQLPDGNKTLISKMLNNIGLIHSERGDFELALDYLQRSLKIKEGLGDEVGVARRLNNIGNMYRNFGKQEKALSYFRRALDQAREIGFKRGISGSLAYIGYIQRDRGEPAAAAKHFEEAVEILLGTGESQILRLLYRELSEAHAEAGQHARALAAFQEYEKLQREIYDQKTSETIAEMQVRFETEQQRKQIELLSQKQALANLSLERQADVRRAIMVGFGLFLSILLLLFHRYRLSARATLMQEAVTRERAVNERLREVDRLKDEFLANTSHELRTPLYGITGLAESLIDGAAGELPEAAREHLSLVVASGRRLSTLVNDVLDFSKLRHHGLDLDLKPVDLRPLVDVILALLRPLVATKGVELHNAVDGDLPPVLADENRLHQILHNLVGNAIKFTESGSVEISAVEASFDDDDGYLAVRVTDTGIGISEPDQQRIFEAFEQADASSVREFSGTGLGLAVSHQLVALHGGELSVESTVGEGSTFTFTLKVAAEALVNEPAPNQTLLTEPETARPWVAESEAEKFQTPTAPADMRPPASKPPPAPTGAARILVVDDEPINLQVLSNYLILEGFELTLASSGTEALQWLEERPFDLVLLDVMMPRLSGFEVCRKLREKHPLAELPVIFLTAKDQDNDVITGMALGANDYLTKPISKDRLLARVRPQLELLHVHRNLEELVAEKMSQVKVLSGLLPICCGCKKIRDDGGYWSALELYIDSHSEAAFSHGICPDCVERYYGKLESREPGGDPEPDADSARLEA